MHLRCVYRMINILFDISVFSNSRYYKLEIKREILSKLKLYENKPSLVLKVEAIHLYPEKKYSQWSQLRKDLRSLNSKIEIDFGNEYVFYIPMPLWSFTSKKVETSCITRLSLNANHALVLSSITQSLQIYCITCFSLLVISSNAVLVDCKSPVTASSCDLSLSLSVEASAFVKPSSFFRFDNFCLWRSLVFMSFATVSCSSSIRLLCSSVIAWRGKYGLYLHCILISRRVLTLRLLVSDSPARSSRVLALSSPRSFCSRSTLRDNFCTVTIASSLLTTNDQKFGKYVTSLYRLFRMMHHSFSKYFFTAVNCEAYAKHTRRNLVIPAMILSDSRHQVSYQYSVISQSWCHAQ